MKIQTYQSWRKERRISSKYHYDSPFEVLKNHGYTFIDWVYKTKTFTPKVQAEMLASGLYDAQYVDCVIYNPSTRLGCKVIEVYVKYK